jgi:hypothetical protein
VTCYGVSPQYRNMKKTGAKKGQRPIRPFQAHRRTTIYKACSCDLGIPTTHENDVVAISLTRHLVQMTLYWAYLNGIYNLAVAYNCQQDHIVRFILGCPDIPDTIKKPMSIVRQHIHVIRSFYKLRKYAANCSYEHRKKN